MIRVTTERFSILFQLIGGKNLRFLSLILVVIASSKVNAAPPTYQQYSESTCLLLSDQITRFKQHPHLPSYQDALLAYRRHCQNPVQQPPRAYFANSPPKAITQPAAAAAAAAAAAEKIATPAVATRAGVVTGTASSVLSSMLHQLIWLLPLLFILWLFRLLQIPWGMNRSEYLGFLAEQKLAGILTSQLSDNYKHYRNIVLKTAQGDLTEIDHLVISPFGIFVVEVKNYQGWIFGGEHHTHWLVQHYRRKNQFQNPLRQNYKHTEAVAHLLEFDDTTKTDKIFSIIAFSNRANFKTVMPINVMHIDEVHRYIQKISAFGRRIGDEALLRYTARLNLLLDQADELRKQHKLQQQGQQLLRALNSRNGAID